MVEEEEIFKAIFLCLFTKDGPVPLDYYSIVDLKKDVDIITIKLFSQSTSGIDQDIEISLLGKLNGPSIFPTVGNLRMVYFYWKIENKFASDPRNVDHGTLAGLYCVFDEKKEEIIRSAKTLGLIENLIKGIISQFSSIEDIIIKGFNLQPGSNISQTHYQQLIQQKISEELALKIGSILNQNVNRYINEVLGQEALYSLPTSEKLQYILNEEGKREEGIVYLVLANNKGLPLTTYLSTYRADSRWITTFTTRKVDALLRFGESSILTHYLFNKQSVEDEINDVYNGLVTGDIIPNEPKTIILTRKTNGSTKNELVYEGVSYTNITLHSGETITYFLLAGCNRKLLPGMLEEVINRIGNRLSYVHKPPKPSIGEVSL